MEQVKNSFLLLFVLIITQGRDLENSLFYISLQLFGFPQSKYLERWSPALDWWGFTSASGDGGKTWVFCWAPTLLVAKVIMPHEGR